MPNNIGYEEFLKNNLKERYNDTKYNMLFMLSLRNKFTERPPDLVSIKLPIKTEIRTKAKLNNDEAFRATRNYYEDEDTDYSFYNININKIDDNMIKETT